MGSTAEIVVNAPLDIPADPMPEMTRPTMNMGELCAAAQMTEPTSKMIKKTRNVHYLLSVLFVVLGEGSDTLMENWL